MKPDDTFALTQWIISQGLQGTPETKLLEGLCERLSAAGVPLLRVNICQPTLHPVIGGHLFIWRRDKPSAVEEDWARNLAAAGGDPSITPFGHVMRTGTPTLRRRLVQDDNRSTFSMADHFPS